MKLSIFFSLVFFASLSFAQEQITEVTQLNDSTFAEVVKVYDTEGRLTSQSYSYFDIGEFSKKIVEQNCISLRGIDEREIINTRINRDVNTLKRFVVDSLGVDYDSLLSKKIFSIVGGEWEFIQRGATEERLTTEVIEHPNRSNLLQMRNVDGAGRWNIKPIHDQKFNLVYEVAGENEDVEMVVFERPNLSGIGYRGRASDGTILILIR